MGPDEDRSESTRRTTVALVVACALLFAIAAGAVVALLAGGEDEEVPAITLESDSPTATIDPEDVAIPAAELERIEAAALRIAGGGTVAEIERSDDAGEAYEIEVITPEGEVDVALDDNLQRVPNLRYDEIDDDL